MKVDYIMPPGPIAGAPAQAERAAALGFDGFFTAETGHEPFLPLVAAAQAAPQLELGTAIAVAFARSPMVTAYTAWDLADLSQGKFVLGLGTQVKAHITRRFSAEWGSPGPRLREYILVLRAIWSTWQHGEPLRFEGDFYSVSLMTPFFNPGPIAHPDIPVAIAGVGPYLSRLAGELCQGFHVHPFHTVSYLDGVTLPAIAKGAASAGRSPQEVDLIGSVFVVTGRDDGEMAMAADVVRQQIAFYASTPSYRPVLEHHGWDFGDELTAMSKRGRWAEMGGVVPDEAVEEVAVVAPPEELAAAVRARYGDRMRRLSFYGLVPGLTTLGDDGWRRLVAETRGQADR